MTRNLGVMPEDHESTGEIDLRAIGAALRRRLALLAALAVGAALLIAVIVNVMTPRYTAQAQVLLENQETFFTRPDRTNVSQSDVAQQLDAEAVASQVQLMTSRDIARKAIKQLGLEGNTEFDSPVGPFKRVLILLGLAHDPTEETRDARIVTNFLDKLVVYSPTKTRVIAIEFQSRDPELAARAANTIASLYLKGQSEAKRGTAQESADALEGQIADLRVRLVKADDERERYRLQSGLLAGSNNMTISGQQLADINSDLSKARTSQADAQAKAQMIRDLLRRGQAADVPDVINNDTVRRIAEQRVQVAGQLALESRTLLPGHPRMQALSAQVGEYDRALKAAAKQAATTLENEATIAGVRVKNLETVLAQQKTQAGTANVDEVHLRALERASDSLKAQLESSSTKYQEALARASSDATPADARIIQQAVAPQEASFPKKLPFIAFGTIAVMALAIGVIVTGELLGGAAPTPVQAPKDATRRDEARRPVERHQAPAQASFAWDDEPAKPVRRAPRTPEPAPQEEEDDDLVFAPAASTGARRPSALKDMLAGGLIGAIVERVRAFGRSAADSRDEQDVDEEFEAAEHDGIGWDAPRASAPAERSVATPQQATDIAPTVDRIVAGHVPGHGLHIVGAGVGAENPGVLIALARALAERGRAVMVDLDRSPVKLAPLTRSEGGAEIANLTGLSELLGGDAAFAEVIHRDHASRLHFIPTGRLEADFRDFDLILDALTATYDFIVMLAPAFPQSEIAKIMAPYADFVVLAPPAGADEAVLGKIERELADAGAREVLVAGRVSQGARQDVA